MRWLVFPIYLQVCLILAFVLCFLRAKNDGHDGFFQNQKCVEKVYHIRRIKGIDRFSLGGLVDMAALIIRLSAPNYYAALAYHNPLYPE